MSTSHFCIFYRKIAENSAVCRFDVGVTVINSHTGVSEKYMNISVLYMDG